MIHEWIRFSNLHWLVALLAAIFLTGDGEAVAQPSATPAAVVRDVLSVPDDQLDYGRAKLVFDRIIDPLLNMEATLAEIDRLARSATAIAGPNATPARKLSALRQVIYQSGDWNGGRPFSYDHADPLGLNVRNKLISTYLATRLGNCVDSRKRLISGKSSSSIIRATVTRW